MVTQRRLKSVSPDLADRAVLYVRVSALMGRDGEDFHSPELQLSAMRRGLAPAGLREVAVVDCDIDVSGRTFSREGLDQIRKMVLQRAVDVILVYDYSRLGRNVSEASTFIKWLAGQGVRVISVNERIDEGSPTGNFTMNMFLNLAQLQSDQIGQKWSDVIDRRAREQGLAHGPVRLGYIKDGRSAVKDPVLGPVVEDIIKRYAANESLLTLAAAFGVARNFPTAPSTIRRIATSPYYLGMVRHHDEWLPGAHEPLIDEEVHAKALRRARRDADMPARSRDPVYSLSGLIWCDSCKGRARCNPTPNGAIVVCSATTTKFPKMCNGFGSPKVRTIESQVIKQVARKIELLQSDPSAQLALIADRERIGEQRGALQRELTRTANAMAKLTAAWAMEQVSDAVYADGMDELKTSEAAIRSALDTVTIPDEAVTPIDLVALGGKLLQLWDRLESPERGRALRTVAQRISLARGAQRGVPVVDVEFI